MHPGQEGFMEWKRPHSPRTMGVYGVKHIPVKHMYRAQGNPWSETDHMYPGEGKFTK
jgi:hypothetical protein